MKYFLWGKCMKFFLLLFALLIYGFYIAKNPPQGVLEYVLNLLILAIFTFVFKGLRFVTS